MSEEKAKEILGKWIQTDDSLFAAIEGREQIMWVKILWTPGDEKLSMRGNFEPEQINAIAWWVSNK